MQYLFLFFESLQVVSQQLALEREREEEMDLLYRSASVKNAHSLVAFLGNWYLQSFTFVAG